MERKTLTLKKIAEYVGTSSSTVSRVLNNKEGVSDKLRSEVQDVLEKSGYTVNYAASTLRKPPLKFVTIFAKQDKFSRYYVEQMYEGYRTCKKSFSAFKIDYEEYFVSLDEEENIELLNRLLEEKDFNIDGMLITPLYSQKSINLLNRFIDRGVPIVLMGRDLAEVDRMTCIRPNNYLAGQIAGELLSKYILYPGKIVICDSDSTVVDNGNSVDWLSNNGFRSAINRHGKNIEIIDLHISNENNELYNAVLNLLNTESDIVGIYSTTARNTVPVGNALKKAGKEKEIIFIGSEVFKETQEMLKTGVLNSVIYKKPFKIGYEALNCLINSVVKGEVQEDELVINPEIIIESNVDSVSDDYTAL